MKARMIWMQEGVSHAQAARRAREAGLEVVEDRCILKEYAKGLSAKDCDGRIVLYRRSQVRVQKFSFEVRS